MLKRYCLRFFLYMPWALLMLGRVDAGTAVFEPLEWTEIRPAAIQTETVISDSPRGRPVIDRIQQSVWLTGDKYIWEWNLRDGAMSRWDQPLGKSDSFLLIQADQSQLIALDSKSAWVLNIKDKKWRKLDGSFSKTCAPARAYVLPPDNSHRVYVATNCGLFLILVDPGQLVSTVGPVLNLAPDLPQIFSRTTDINQVLTTRGRELVALMLDGPRVRDRVVYTAKSSLKGVAQTGKAYLAWSSQAIVFFDEEFERRQVVPVLGNRKITAVGASTNTHMVAFSDGTLEVMNLKQQKKMVSSKRDYFPNFIDILADDALAVLSTETGLPRVFRFSAGIGVTPHN